MFRLPQTATPLYFLSDAGIFPLSASGFEQLQAAMERLTLNDASGKCRQPTAGVLVSPLLRHPACSSQF